MVEELLYLPDIKISDNGYKNSPFLSRTSLVTGTLTKLTLVTVEAWRTLAISGDMMTLTPVLTGTRLLAPRTPEPCKETRRC